LVAVLLVAGGLGLGAAGGREWLTFHRVAAVEVRADGALVRLPSLPDARRYDARVVLRGAFVGRFNGVHYDAVESINADGGRRPHGCLELTPAVLAAVRGSRPSHRTFEPATDASGAPVTARWVPDRVVEDMQLPPGTQHEALEGALSLEVWTRDRSRQGSAAGVLSLLGGLLCCVGLFRVRECVRLERGVLAPRTEAALLLERIRERQADLWRELRGASDGEEPPAERLRTIGEIAEELARSATESARLPGAEAAATYQACLARLRETEAALAQITARLQTRERLRPDLLRELFATLDRELGVLTGSDAACPLNGPMAPSCREVDLMPLKPLA